MLKSLIILLGVTVCATMSLSCASRQVLTEAASSCEITAPASNLAPLDTLLFDKLRSSGVPCKDGILETVEKLSCAKTSTRRGGRHYTCLIRFADTKSEVLEISGSAARELAFAANERFGNARYQPTQNPDVFRLEHLECLKLLTRGRTLAEASTIDICRIRGRKSKRSAREWLNDSEITDAREMSVAKELAMKAIDQFADAECEIIESRAVRSPSSPVDVLSLSIKCADQPLVATVKIVRDVRLQPQHQRQDAVLGSAEVSKSYILPVEINETGSEQSGSGVER